MEGSLGKPVTPAAKPKWFYGAVAVSLLLHAVLIITLIQVANWEPHEPEVAPVMVDIVPPPEPEEPELELNVPEYEVAEKQESASPPPPPPEDVSQDEEQLAQSASQLPVMKPVIEFGETDSGPRIDREGVSNEDLNDPEIEQSENSEPGTGKADEVQEADTGTLDVQTDETAEITKEPTSDLAEGSEPTIESILAAEGDVSPDASDTVEPNLTLVTPEEDPVQDPAAAAQEGGGAPDELPSVEQLYSETMIESPRVQTAMENLPRSKRAGILCMTEMRGQLLASSPPYPPEILPSYALPAGTVLETRKAAFRSQGKWFDLAFRCEVDEDVTKVLNFSYRVGQEIPRSQWSERGFPSF